MAEEPKRDRPEAEEGPIDVALLTADDPGGSHAKGYTAEPGPLVRVPPEGALPLAPPPQHPTPIHVPERDEGVRPTGRREPGDYTPNDHLMGADR